MADCSRALSSRMTRLARAAVAATQIIATGMNITIIDRIKRRPSAPSPPK